jgi:hypothetical protein
MQPVISSTSTSIGSKALPPAIDPTTDPTLPLAIPARILDMADGWEGI